MHFENLHSIVGFNTVTTLVAMDASLKSRFV